MKLIAPILSSTIIPFVVGQQQQDLFLLKVRGTDNCFSSINASLTGCDKNEAVFSGSLSANSKICSKIDPELCINSSGKMDNTSKHPEYDIFSKDSIIDAKKYCLATDGKALVRAKKLCNVPMIAGDLDIDGYIKVGKSCLNPGKPRKTKKNGDRKGGKAKLGACNDNSSWYMEEGNIIHIITEKCLQRSGKNKLIVDDCDLSKDKWSTGAHLKYGSLCLKAAHKSPKFSLNCESGLEFVKVDEKITNACFPEKIFANGDEGWEKYSEKIWFKKESNNVSVTEAQNFCESKYGGSNLAKIDSKDVANWMKENLDIKDKHWVGLKDKNASDKRIFHWQDGTKVDDSLWGKDEPSNSAEQCVNIFSKKDAEKGLLNLNDGGCDFSARFICEGPEPLDDIELNSFKERPETENAMVWYNKLYISISTKKPWAEALKYCNTHFNTLAKVDNSSLITWFQASDGLNNKEDEFYWVGGKEIRNFRWIDDSPVEDSLWHDNKPNRADEKCVEVFDDGSRVGLNDVKCVGKVKSFICERRC